MELSTSEIQKRVDESKPLTRNDFDCRKCGCCCFWCAYLEGIIGDDVTCTNYDDRYDECRELTAGSPECCNDRMKFGMLDDPKCMVPSDKVRNTPVKG